MYYNSVFGSMNGFSWQWLWRILSSTLKIEAPCYKFVPHFMQSYPRKLQCSYYNITLTSIAYIYKWSHFLQFTNQNFQDKGHKLIILSGTTVSGKYIGYPETITPSFMFCSACVWQRKVAGTHYKFAIKLFLN